MLFFLVFLLSPLSFALDGQPTAQAQLQICSLREAAHFIDLTEKNKKLIAFYHTHGNPLLTCPWIHREMSLTPEVKKQIEACLVAEAQTLRAADLHLKRLDVLHRAYKFQWIGGEMSDDDSLKVLPERIWKEQLSILERLGFSKEQQHHYSIIINSLAQHFALKNKINFEALEDDKSRRASLVLLKRIATTQDKKERKEIEKAILEQTKVRDETAMRNAFQHFDKKGSGLFAYGKSHRDYQKLLMEKRCK